MWGLSIFNVFSKYSKEHQKLLKLAYDIIEFVKVDYEREQLQKRLREAPKKEIEIICAPEPTNIWDMFDEHGYIERSEAKDFWDKHTLDSDGNITFRKPILKPFYGTLVEVDNDNKVIRETIIGNRTEDWF